MQTTSFYSRSIFFIIAFSVGASLASAQSRPAPVIEVPAGVLVFADDGTVTEGAIGASFRAYLSPRVSVGPELLFISGQNHSHTVLTGNLTFDLSAQRTVTPFLVAGAGLFRTSEQFPNRATYSSTEGAFTAGGGVRAGLSRSVFVAVDTRVGWELHWRVNGVVGVAFR